MEKRKNAVLEVRNPVSGQEVMSTSEQKDFAAESTVRQKAPAQTPPIATIIKPARGWLSFGLREIWAYRELVYFLIWRDVKVRYKQTAIGAAWAVLQPLMTMVMFTLVFRGLANVPSDGLPYSVFAYSALLPWTFFSGALARCSGSIVGQSNLISKVYFPRLIVPLSAAISGIVDFAIAFLMLVGLMIWYGIRPTVGVLMLPVLLVLTLATALAIGLWLSAFNVKYRDVGQITPFLIQVWMFASPVAYSASLIPERWRLLYSLNPMAGVIEGFRWALLGTKTPDFLAIAISAVMVVGLLFGGVVYFKRMERMFADII
jgi:lipopolysaccharide transport system permease protein